jgi:hypothetical protein
MEMTDTGKPLWFLTCLVVAFNRQTEVEVKVEPR